MPKPLQLFIVDDEALARKRLRNLLADCQSELPNTVVGEAGCSQDALHDAGMARADVVLLDIDRPGQDGLSCARALAQRAKPPAVIFVTAHQEHAMAAFDVAALDYLLKPVRLTRLLGALKRVHQIETEVARYFTVNDRGRVLRVGLEQVLYLRAELKYVTLRTRELEFVLTETLGQIEQDFPRDFLRIHRNCLVNRSHLTGFEFEHGEGRWYAVLRDWPERWVVSRRQSQVVRDYRHP